MNAYVLVDQWKTRPYSRCQSHSWREAEEYRAYLLVLEVYESEQWSRVKIKEG
jgi:hypothetical protein